MIYMSGDIHFFHSIKAVPQTLPQSQYSLTFLMHLFFCDPEGFTHTNQLMGREGT